MKKIAQQTLVFALFGLTISAVAQQSQRTIRIQAQEENGAPVAAATVTLKRGAEIAGALSTNEKGEAAANLPAGKYEVTITKEGFEPRIQRDVNLSDDASVEIKFRLEPKILLNENIEVSANANAAAAPEQTASTGLELRADEIKYLPNKPTQVTDALPLLPGVIRTFQGGIKISGSGENRSAFIVNSADVTDPATGQFGMTVPVDSVQTINVFKAPYLAQYGRFSAGVVSVETKRGGDKWNFELNDPLPEFRLLNGGLRGLREATPRIVFNGPLFKNRLYISEGSEYAIRKRPVQTLEYPNKETKSESVNSFTQFDAILSATHTLTGTFHFATRRDSFVNLDFFNRRPVTPNSSGKDYTGMVIDRLTLGENLLESTVSVKHYSLGVWGQGKGEMNLSPTGNTGNYFSEQNRTARRAEWMEILSLKPISVFNGAGSHNLKFGSIFGRTGAEGEFIARPVNILDAQGNRLRRIEFTGGRPFDREDHELVGFGQDHWVVTPKLGFDLGLRLERQGITKTFRIAPRAGLAWAPFANHMTVFRAGFGVFYDRVPLSVYAFTDYPEQVITTYGPDGSVIDGPRHFYNITDSYERKGNPFLRGKNTPGNFAPYSSTWNVEVEHALSPWLKLRANYLSSNSEGLITVEPRAPSLVDGRDALALGGAGRGRYRQVELTGRVTFGEGKQQLFLSYVNSRSRATVNEFNSYIGNFPSPVVRSDQYARGSADLPHRFLAWGVFNLPWKTRLAPIVEYRNGLPFSTLDPKQNYVGEANSKRFPNFFSMDARVSKDFQISPKYAFRFSVSGVNLTNHFNALDTHRNIGDPRYGAFFGNVDRRFQVDFDVIF
jgi:hypothetical protein